MESTLKVVDGKACFERDSVTFNYPNYNFKLLSTLGFLFSKQDKVNVLDFGGALGSEYWKNRKMIYQYKKDFSWNVIEQKKFVEIGNEMISNDELFFFNNIYEINKKIDLAIFSSVLQYIEDYKSNIISVINMKPQYIIIDRQPILQNKSRICIQYVSEEIYAASYPLQIINERELLDLLEKEYDLIVSDYSSIESGFYYVDAKEFRFKDYLFKRKSS